MRDHPRSRGVYKPSEAEPQLVAGSSPLARGLPHSHTGGRIVGRIIPARAGFTRSLQPAVTRHTDHPRSRGVYGPLPSPPLAGTGSSPLARGFTSTGCGPGRPPRDHPRSRGVYTAVQGVRTPVAGSSPLARGLLDLQPRPGIIERIIPARAGFTASVRTRRLSDGDHPRSRGVYKCGGITIVRRGGSSPLARGLRQGLRVLLKAVRIIPARAGFTWRRSP